MLGQQRLDFLGVIRSDRHEEGGSVRRSLLLEILKLVADLPVSMMSLLVLVVDIAWSGSLGVLPLM